VLFGLAFEMKAQLVGELPVDGSAPNEGPDAVEQIGEHAAA